MVNQHQINAKYATCLKYLMSDVFILLYISKC